MTNIIGREREIDELMSLYNSGKAEFVAVYGRRRVGKTYLIDETFRDKITFRHAGLSPVDEEGKKQLTKDQLLGFYYSLKIYGMTQNKKPKTWMEAFFMLEQLLMEKDNGQRLLVFLDELPWMDTVRSGFVRAFESFWNSWACHRHNVMLVVCGSATSWMQDNLMNNHGGLYGRITYEICLRPFTLAECEEYYKSRDIRMSRYDMVQSYMIFGGIPYYLGYLRRECSLAQNVEEIFFSRQAKLKNEYDRMLSSAFSNPEEIKSIIKVLSGRRSGYTRQEISRLAGITDGGGLTKLLRALEASDYILTYQPFGLGKRQNRYKLIDHFSLFYLRFVKDTSSLDEGLWSAGHTSSKVTAWRGFAFEEVCLSHIGQIKKSLGISGVSTKQSAWSVSGDSAEEGTQIDLLIIRKDNVVNMCEMKFYSDEFVVDKSYHRVLVHRQNLLSEQIPRKMIIHPTLISTYGIRYNEYFGDFVKVLTIDSLFEK